MMALNTDDSEKVSAYNKSELTTRVKEIEEPIVPHLKRTYDVSAIKLWLIKVQ